MKIDYSRIYVGNILICDRYSCEIDSFGDHKKPKCEGHIKSGCEFELLIQLGEDISGKYFVPVNLVKGEHNLLKISKSVDEYIKSCWKKPLKNQEVILQDIVHEPFKEYVGDFRPVFPNKSGKIYFRELKQLREQIKSKYYQLQASNTNNTQLNDGDNLIEG